MHRTTSVLLCELGRAHRRKGHPVVAPAPRAVRGGATGDPRRAAPAIAWPRSAHGRVAAAAGMKAHENIDGNGFKS